MSDEQRDYAEEQYNGALLHGAGDAYDLTAGELLSIPLLPTGVIVGLRDEITIQRASDITMQLKERFPGVRFAVVGGCTALVSFTYDEEPQP